MPRLPTLTFTSYTQHGQDQGALALGHSFKVKIQFPSLKELQRFVKSVNHVYIDIKSNLLKLKLKIITEMWPELDKQAASGSVAKNGQFI